MAEFLKLSLDGLPQKERLFASMRERTANLMPYFEFLHRAWLIEQTQQFLSQGAFFLGRQWAPLNQKYAERKLAKFGPPPFGQGILYRSGLLYASLTAEDAPEHVKVITPDEAVFGSTVPYGKYHQTGTPRMPQRTVIYVRDWFRRFALRALITYMLKGEIATAA